MALTESQKEQIKVLLRKKIENKLKKYGRETTSMPFLSRLIQDDEKIAAYSFIHSVATTLGMSIYEDVSVIIASANCQECFRNYGVGGIISKEQKSVIARIITELRNGNRKSNIEKEMQEVVSASAKKGSFQKAGNIADLYLNKNGMEYFFEIKTVKPNIDVFEKSKTKLLEWIARKRKPVKVFLAFPYNPYHPEPYSRFTETGMMNYPHDLLIGEEYWNFIGGENTFPELLKTFDEVGKEFKEKLSNKFQEIAKQKISSY